MLYLSRIILAPRSWQVRRDLANSYQMHRTLMRAFPDAEAGGPGRVLWRMEQENGDKPVLLVQSDKQPDWTRLEPGWAAAHPQCKEVELKLTAGQQLRFRLRANPTARRKISDTGDVPAKRRGLLTEAEQLAWLERKGRTGGFRVASASLVSEGVSMTHRREGKGTLTHVSVLYEGVLIVTQPELLVQQVQGGVGSAKAFGFGLLSLARPSR